MSRAFYLNLAVDNLKKNARTIIPYILTSVLTTMMLYMVVSLANNPNLNEMLGAMTLTQMLGFGVVIIEIFAFIFLFYTKRVCAILYIRNGKEAFSSCLVL